MLAQAVHQSRWWTWQGLTERLFTAWFGGFVYNQIWEDPRVDLEALQLTPQSRILTIASGGCNILNYLVHAEGPAAILAVDLNCHHMYLTRLKIEAVRRLPSHDDFFRFFGHADDPINVTNFRRFIRTHLDEPTRRFWESRRGWRFFRGPRIGYFAKNFYNHAKFGQLMRITHALAKLTKRNPALMLAAQSLEEQRRVFEETYGPFFDHWFIRMTGRMPLVCYSLGIPPRQYRALRGDSASIVDVYRERVQRLACQFPVQDNYFTWQAFGRSYDTAGKQALPEYLREERWNVLSQRIDRVQTHITSATTLLQQQPDESMDRFVFLDAQDWMKSHEITDLWTEVARVGKPGSRIIFRTAAADSPVETALPPELRQRFTYHREASADLYQRDRSAIYGGFHLYTLDR
jgi:S-adenosylmethionine-diacylglycerol 3-amino-3-carboxypropyl transferase